VGTLNLTETRRAPPDAREPVGRNNYGPVSVSFSAYFFSFSFERPSTEQSRSFEREIRQARQAQHSTVLPAEEIVGEQQYRHSDPVNEALTRKLQKEASTRRPQNEDAAHDFLHKTR
jgi:hypothetical protein